MSILRTAPWLRTPLLLLRRRLIVVAGKALIHSVTTQRTAGVEPAVLLRAP